MKRRVILDTNFLLIPGQFKVDIFSEIGRICNFSYELVVVPETLEELESIACGEASGRDKRAARLALQLLKKFKVRAVNRKLFKRADEAILDIADRKSIVATQDRILKTRLRGKCGLVVLRQKRYLQIYE